MAPSLNLDRLIRWAGERLGFDPGALRLARLEEAAQVEIARLGSVAVLDQALDERDARVEAALVAAVTVGETYFFRQREHFDLLAQLPSLSRPQLRVWSAGCSSGEEAYSLAAALRALTKLEAPQLTVWGTDVNAASLAVARSAHYGRWSWRETDSTSASPHEARVLDPLNRACVQFATHNLLERPLFDGGEGPRFDLVFCRNVLVYFSAPAAARALAAILEALQPGGWLVLGNTDLPGAPLGLRRIGPSALCVYEKVPPQAESPASRSVTVTASAQPAVRTPRVPVSEPHDPVEWHRRTLGLIEEGKHAPALKELERLSREHQVYLPGRFEYALALRRDGQTAAAARELRAFLKQVEGRSLDEDVPGPESLSLEFYVNSAHSFISSTGGEA